LPAPPYCFRHALFRRYFMLPLRRASFMLSADATLLLMP